MGDPADQHALREALARALCSEWGYLWEGDPYDDDQVVPENDGDLNDRPSKALFRRGADALIAGPLAPYLATEAENTRLKETVEAIGGALEPFVAHYEPWMDGWQADEHMGTYARITFRQFHAARSVLATIPPKENPDA